MSNQLFIDNILKQQEEIKKKQDKDIDEIIGGVDRIKDKANVINDELDKQNKMLNKMDYKVEKVSCELKIVTKKTDNLAKQPSTVFGWILRWFI